jgi:hypothetical protein
MKIAVLLLSVFISHLSFATDIQCPERYPNGNRLIDGSVLRYESGNRLIDGDVWRYENGNRLVDSDVWRYENGNRLIDGDIWRYENGNRFLDFGNIIRYETGDRLRNDDGNFYSKNGNLIGGNSFEYLVGTSDGTSILFELTNTEQSFVVSIFDQGHTYEIAYKPGSSQPASLKCILKDDSKMDFTLNSKSARVEVKVKAGQDPVVVREAIQKALDSL